MVRKDYESVPEFVRYLIRNDIEFRNKILNAKDKHLVAETRKPEKMYIYDCLSHRYIEKII